MAKRAALMMLAVAIAGLLARTTTLVGDDQVTLDAQRAPSEAVRRLLAGEFAWTTGGPVVGRHADGDGQTYFSIKDPSIVRHNGRWHLFCSVRGKPRTHQVEYLSFADWPDATKAARHLLKASDGFYCAPQVFYFRPQKKWYMICQASDESWQSKYGAAYATSDDISKPDSWSKLRPLGARHADGKAGLDYWIICDERSAYLFFTTLDGRMWRERTSLDAFPGGWSEAELALRGDVFEASHTYKLKGMDKYLTIIEAQGKGGRRYYKAYLADRLDGPWTPAAATAEKCFAGADNVSQTESHWTDSISHVELIRTGSDERLEVDPENIEVLFQGVSDKDRTGKPYGEIPWRLGLLKPTR